MRGTYKITIGDQVYTYENVITDTGKNRIFDAVAGKAPGFASSIMAGIGTTAATSTDSRLVFPVGGGDINATITDLVNSKIYFKATLPASDVYEIRELGCFSSTMDGLQGVLNGGSVTLLVFGSSTDWTDSAGVHTISSTNNRIGTNSIQYAINNTTVKGYTTFIQQDFAYLPDNATFDFAYYANNLSNLTMRFKVDNDNYFEATLDTTNGYNIESVQKSAFVATGVPTWTTLGVWEIEATSASADGVLSMDALKYSTPVTTEPTLLSRVVLPEPQQKLVGVSFDVEYVLSLGV